MRTKRKTPMRRARDRAELSQAQAARRADISQAHWCQIERGDSQPTIEVAYRIASVLETTVDHLWPPKEVPAAVA